MNICYVLLSPTIGMHQYTADFANRMAYAGHSVHLVTTTRAPHDCYAPAVTIRTPVSGNGTGFSAEGLQLHSLRALQSVIGDLCPDVVHFTGPHLWNIPLVNTLAACGIPTVHTLHDLDPHYGTRHATLIRLWNRLIIRSAHHILVHGQIYRERLIALKIPPEQVTYMPLLFLFLSYPWMETAWRVASQARYEPWALFFGRLEKYKGVDHLLTACAMMDGAVTDSTRVVVAGPGNFSALWGEPLPRGVELRNRFIADEEALDLFRRCGLVVLPYLDATQSALIAAAYYFRKPVVVTHTGALPEYVEDGQTGCVIEPAHPASLARCLVEMLSDPVRLAQMGSAGRLWYDIYRAAEMRTLTGMYQQLTRKRADGYIREAATSPLASYADGYIREADLKKSVFEA